jgi:hypothetical protein
MRRWNTVVIVAAVVIVGALAAVDAFRGREPGASPPPRRGTTTQQQRPPTLVETLRGELVFGRVLYSDQECHIHSLVLPQMLDEVPLDGPDRCRFASTDGWILGEDELLSPNWRFIAQCRDGEIIVRNADTGHVRRTIEGCVGAWRPRAGNRLTWARGEAIYERGRPLLTRDDLHAIARHHPNVRFLGPPFRVHVADLAWMDTDHLVASLEIRAPYAQREYLAVLLEGKTVIGQATNFQDRLGRWFASPAGSFMAASEGTMLTADGTTIPRPDALPEGRAVAFSPDERWLAYVTGRSIYAIGTPANNEPGRIIRIPIPARDLAWERISQPTRVAGLGTG